MAHIVIIGAGLTGLSAAYHLEKQGFFDYTILEKESAIGGLCGSVHQDGFTFDYTGHLLHASDDYFYNLLKNVVGLDNFNVIDRRSYIYSHNTFTDYPFQINLHGLPTSVIADCIEGFVTRKKNIKNPQTFMQWVHKNFGAGFAKHFFAPYQRKIFAYDLKEITASWTGRFVPSTSLHQIIDGALGKKAPSVGYNARFLYPKQGGINAWVQKLADQLHNKIETNTEITRIDMQNKIIHYANGQSTQYTTLINTMPLDHLIGTLRETSRTRLKHVQHKLKCNSVVNFNLGINKKNISDKHWVYFPEKQYPFYRVGFWHNFADSMAPKDCSSMYGEFAHLGKSSSWIKKTTQKSIKIVQKLFGFSNDEIITHKTLNIKHAYVIYDQWRDRNLHNVHQRLHEHDIHSIGRYGYWKYSSMQEAVLDGKQIAHQLIIKPARKIITAQTHMLPTRKKKEIQYG